jgi:hypothetical protein
MLAIFSFSLIIFVIIEVGFNPSLFLVLIIPDEEAAFTRREEGVHKSLFKSVDKLCFDNFYSPEREASLICYKFNKFLLSQPYLNTFY